MSRRHDSVMVHSTRKSYKDKYLALQKQNSTDIGPQLQVLENIHEFSLSSEKERAELHKIIQEIAEEVTTVNAFCDTSDGKFGLTFKDVTVPCDYNLSSLDAKLILRRARDVLRQLCSRLNVAAIHTKLLNERVANFATSIDMLQPSLERAQRGYIESYKIGYNPTDVEMSDLVSDRSKNPRSAYEYFSADESSESESEEEVDIPKTLAIRNSRGPPNSATPAKKSVTKDAIAIN